MMKRLKMITILIGRFNKLIYNYIAITKNEAKPQ